MKTTLTLTRVFKKELLIEVDEELIKGMSAEQIGTFLLEQSFDYNAEFEKAELEQIDFNEDSLNEADTDRFDIYDNGKHIYGGHL